MSHPSQESKKSIYSCRLCSKRKVRCDKQFPCSNCTKCGVQCVQADISAPRPRKKRFAEAELLARLSRYEIALKAYGADLEEINAGNPPGMRNTGIEKKSQTTSPSLMARSEDSDADDGLAWPTAQDQLKEEQSVLRGSDSDDLDETPITSTWNAMYETDGSHLLFGLAPPLVDLAALHPHPGHIFSMWHSFLSNVNPLTKIIHAPSLQQQIIHASSQLDKISNALHALMFGIYAMAVSSIDHDECQRIYGQSTAALVTRFHAGAQQALRQASALRSNDLMALQAFVLHLYSIRASVDPRTLSCFSGMADRVGRRMGLHRAAHMKDVSVFESEMRKRLWSQIGLLELRMAELSGCGTSSLSPVSDALLPMNINDSDLDPDMTLAPKEKEGATEMMFCGPRNDVAEFVRRVRLQQGINLGFHEFCGPKVNVAEADRSIDDLEKRITEKYLQYCDPQIPLHVMATVIAKCSVDKLRYSLHSARYIFGNGLSLPDTEKEILFKLCVRVVERHNTLRDHPGANKFLWFMNFHKPFIFLIHIAFNLRFYAAGEWADRAWKALGHIMIGFLNHTSGNYHHIPSTFVDTPLHLAFANLVSKAWDAREQDLRQKGPVLVPDFVAELKEKLARRRNTLSSQEALPAIDFSTQANGGFDMALFSNDLNQLTSTGDLDQMWFGDMTNSISFNNMDSSDMWGNFAPTQMMMQNVDWNESGPYMPQ